MKAVVGALALGVLGLVACADDPNAPSSYVDIGVYAPLSGKPPDPIDIRATATAGTPFDVWFYTCGDGCEDSVRTDVSLTSDGALVIPYDRFRPACHLAADARYQHGAALTFATPGTYTVVFRFRGDGDQLVDQPRTVMVQ